VLLWNVKTGRATPFAPGHSIFALAFNPDGTRIATASLDKTVTIWNRTTGQEALILRGHSAKVTAVAFSHDGKRLAAGCEDGTVYVRDATPLEARATIRSKP
jgi:WD40 repeat protein